MVKCPNCDFEMKDGKDAYLDDDNGVIVIHDVLRCPNCGEVVLSSEQMKRFTEKLKALGLWKEGKPGPRVSS
ncbi:MAG: hypothetical protein AOA65_0032 [Candidatus Bathyarchaeota archaeon BA1]|nr:MAG: hypothetical protein AOA65_0032 [Candidatus Bathyarchaeota archaeon BA1]